MSILIPAPFSDSKKGPSRASHPHFMRRGDQSSSLLLDKLGERIGSTRILTRLYDAFLAKLKGNKGLLPGVSRNKLRVFRAQQASHFNLVADVVEELEADPTAQTPSAIVIGVASLGLIQAVQDPQTAPLQCLEVILTAALADLARWEVLLEVAQAVGEDDLVPGVHRVIGEERHHLATLRRWYKKALLREPE